MFSLKVHHPGGVGHDVFECTSYGVRPEATGVVRVLLQQQGGEKEVVIAPGGFAYVMGDGGKTVEVIRARAQGGAQLRGA